MRIIVSDKPLAPVELNDKIPLSLSQLVMACCRENPAERPADMQQVVARLAVVEKLWKKYRDNVREQWLTGRKTEEPPSDQGEDSDAPVALHREASADEGPPEPLGDEE
jgi:hypothetical protein